MKEDAAAAAIRLLTLFRGCLQALICFTDVARAPPSTAPMTECLVAAVSNRKYACARNASSDSGRMRGLGYNDVQLKYRIIKLRNQQ